MKQIKQYFYYSLFTSLLLSFHIVLPAVDACENNMVFTVGAGVYDITGPAAEEGMMGYSLLEQKTTGIYQRLWARAFVISSACNGKRIVFVNADLGQLFQGIKQEVVRKLQQKYGNTYSDANVLLTANHQHSGPGGYSTHALYNLSALGFDRDNFNTIVDGIVHAIERAQTNMTNAQIKLAQADLMGASFNRSPTAYEEDPADERARYQSNVDTLMTLIRFNSTSGKPIGFINWFAVHCTSMNNKNTLINSDNKGYAEYLFEKDFQSDYGPKSFVAAFAQSDCGDVSPNHLGHEGGTGLAGLKIVEEAALSQYNMAKQLFNSASELLKGGIDYRHTYIKMDDVTIDPAFTNGTQQKTCTAAIGISMLAGTQDGEGFGKQGITCAQVSGVFPMLACSIFTTPCQGVKPIALQTGSMTPYPWTPNILPLQLFKMGNLAIAACSFELTTMAGRRLREMLEKQLAPIGINHVVLSGLANAYAGYITTQEEYQLQRYEGASNHFGPWSLAAIMQEFSKLATAMVAGTPSPAGPTPSYLADKQINLQTGVVFDDKPLDKDFGSVYQDVRSTYKPGDTVSVTFWGAHPRNNFRIQDTFLEVQRLVGKNWVTVARDRDWDTEYHWKRDGIANSLITIVWRIPQYVLPGTYRIAQYGNWKSGWDQQIRPYTGYSSNFTVNAGK